MKLTSNKLKLLSIEADIDSIGVISATSFKEAKQRVYLNNLHQDFISSSSGWKIENIDDYYFPANIFKEAKSIIVALESYPVKKEENIYNEPSGTIAYYTRSNYYRSLERKLDKLTKLISKELGYKFWYKRFSSGPFSAKAAAEKAGIGWYGKHSIILNHTFGSWFVLGSIVTDLELEETKKINNECNNCQQCVKNCPTQALKKPCVLDRKKCIQYLANWKGKTDSQTREIWGNRWYGCTSCQDVCPINKTVKTIEKKAETGYVGAFMPLLSLLKMSEYGYREKYKHNQITAKWIDFECMRRNAVIALGNIGDPVAISTLKHLLDNSEDLVRSHIPWALWKISKNNKGIIKNMLEKKYHLEENNIVKEEINLVLQKM